MEKSEGLTKVEKILYDILGGIIIILQIENILFCIYRNIKVANGLRVPYTFIFEIILAIFAGILMIKNHRYIRENIKKYYSILNKIIITLNITFSIIFFSYIVFLLLSM